MDQQRHFHDADTVHRANTAKMPETFLGSSVQILMLRLAQVDSYLDLTEFWQEASSAQKSQQRNVLQRALDEAMAICVPGGNRRTHIVMPSLTKTIPLTLEFRTMTNPDDLSTGIQPFILVQTTATEWQQAQALVHIYDTIMGGASTATIADAQFLVVANDPA
jgi:hypothetical protein